jgi:hypothetical protein
MPADADQLAMDECRPEIWPAPPGNSCIESSANTNLVRRGNELSANARLSFTLDVAYQGEPPPPDIAVSRGYLIKRGNDCA